MRKLLLLIFLFVLFALVFSAFFVNDVIFTQAVKNVLIIAYPILSVLGFMSILKWIYDTKENDRREKINQTQNQIDDLIKELLDEQIRRNKDKSKTSYKYTTKSYINVNSDDHHYKNLELAFGASLDEVGRSFRRLSKIHHPDISKGSADRFNKIKDSYEYLKKKLRQ